MSVKIFSNKIALALSLFLLAACPAPGPSCVGADEWGQTEDITVKIDPKKQYNSAGISVRAGEPLTIEQGGAVDLCPDATMINASTVATETKKPIKPQLYGWQDSGQTVSAGAKLVITVSEGYKDSSGAMQTSGKGLYAYIASESEKSAANGDWWYGRGAGYAPASNRLAMDGPVTCHPSPADPTKCNRFFELWDNGTTGVGGSGFSGIAPASGKLYFRYARTASARGLNDSGDGKMSPWKGPYRWQHDRCTACRITTIMGVCAGGCAGALFGWPICYAGCVAGWTAGCASSGHLERATSDTSYRSSKCQEWYDIGTEYQESYYWGNNGFDHFVNERHSDAEYNEGPGYDISISNGCPGTFGKYMNMLIGTSSATLVPSTTQVSCPANATGCTVGAKGCRVGTAGCIIDRDSFSQAPIMQAQFTVNAGSTTDMNSSGIQPDGTFSNPALPAGFTRRGHYESVVPSTGELWFEIMDTENEKSANNPNGGYYADNLGSYELRIQTTKVNSMMSGLLNSMVNPIRKIIFGYCRIADNPATGDIDESRLANDTVESECFPGPTPVLDAQNNPVLNVDGTPKMHPGAWQSGITKRMFNTLVGSGMFINSVRAALVLMVIVYGMLFMMGMIKEMQDVLIKKIIKIAIIVQLISPGSWEFFNQYLFTFFIDGMNTLIGMMAGDFMGAVSSSGSNVVGVANVTNPFAFVDGTISKFLNFATFAKLLGLLFTSPMGFIYILLILAGMVFFLRAVIQATILYILSMLTIALLLILAPLFISFTMFVRTKPYFDKWMQSLISYLFQPVLVFTALSIFNVFVYSAIYTLLHYGVCWKNVLGFTIPFGALGDLYIPLFKFYMPDSGHDGGPIFASGMPISFFLILIFIIITSAMLKFVDFMASLSGSLVTGSQNMSLNKAANGVVAMGGNLMKAVGGKALGAVKSGFNAAGNKANQAMDKHNETTKR